MIVAKEERWMPLISPPTTSWSGLVVSVLSVGLVLSVLSAVAAANFGDPLPGLMAAQQAAFEAGREEFAEEESIEDGLGPVFNGTSCASCHSVPAIGGDSTVVETRFGTLR
jgi:hypothetical protein